MSGLDERHTTPDLLVPGDIILDSRGRETVVEDTTAKAVHLRVGDKVHEVPLERLPVQVPLVATAAEVHERALALAQVRLGGEVVAHKDGDGPYRCPERFVDLASLLGHLYLAHLAPGRDPKVPPSFPTATYAEADAWHRDEHTRVLVVPHTHEPAFYQRAGLDTPSSSA